MTRLPPSGSTARIPESTRTVLGWSLPGWGSSRCCLREEAPQPSPQNASALPSRGWVLSGSCLSQPVSEACKILYQSDAENLGRLLQRGRAPLSRLRLPGGLPGLGVPLQLTKAGQRPRAEEGKEQKGEERSTSSKPGWSIFRFLLLETTA